MVTTKKLGAVTSRTAAVVAIVVMTIILLVGCGGKRDRRSMEYKHVLLLTVDTQRPDYLGLGGYDLPTSPAIDSLMAQGTYFTRALTPIPRTTQALGSLLTGCYPHTTGLRTLFDSLSTDVWSLAQVAQLRGYHTVAVVSNHVLPPERGLNRGFGVYDFAGDWRIATETTNAAIDHLRSYTPNDPLFVWVHYIDPHVPYYPPRELAREFDPEYTGRYEYHFGDTQGGTGNNAYPSDLGKKRAVFQNDLPDEVNEHIRKLYAADVRFTDDAIAVLLRWLRDNLGNDWLIVYAADHGESLGEHDFYFDHGDYVYNASLRVPLGFVFPVGDSPYGEKRGRQVDDWVSLVDVTPTLLEILGLEMPAALPYSVEGRSLAPLLRGEVLASVPYFAECGYAFFPEMVKRRVDFDVWGRFRCVVHDDWKLIWTPGQTEEFRYELYNMVDDPHEINDLAAGNPDVTNQLVSLLRRWTVRSAGPEMRRPSPKDLKLLRSLGYIE
jgi:arylsulfatase A-like enzyme